jgi:hypothetical protein
MNHRKRVFSPRRCWRRKREHHQIHQHKERCKGHMVRFDGPKSSNLRRKVNSVVICIFISFALINFTLLCLLDHSYFWRYP